jgi:hypothetical protein
MNSSTAGKYEKNGRLTGFGTATALQVAITIRIAAAATIGTAVARRLRVRIAAKPSRLSQGNVVRAGNALVSPRHDDAQIRGAAI